MSLTQNFKELEASLFSLNKILAGMKSAVAHRKSFDLKSASSVPESPVVKCDHDFQHGFIEIKRIFDNAIVFEGKQRFSDVSGKVLEKKAAM